MASKVHEYQLRLLSVTSVAEEVLQRILINLSEEYIAQNQHLHQVNKSALSIILNTYKVLLIKDSILNTATNKLKMFDINGNAHAQPDVSTFDVSMTIALLRRIPVYPTHIPDKPPLCGNNCIQKCCAVCQHKNNQCCGLTYNECRAKKNICCDIHNLCGFCQPQPPHCQVFKLKKGLDLIRRIRNTAAHGGDFDMLERNGVPLSEFPNSQSWVDLSKEVNDAFKDVLHYMMDGNNFQHSRKGITPGERADVEVEIKIALERNTRIVERYFNDSIFRLVVNFTKVEDVDDKVNKLSVSVDHVDNKIDQLHLLLQHQIDGKLNTMIQYQQDLETVSNTGFNNIQSLIQKENLDIKGLLERIKEILETEKKKNEESLEEKSEEFFIFNTHHGIVDYKFKFNVSNEKVIEEKLEKEEDDVTEILLDQSNHFCGDIDGYRRGEIIGLKKGSTYNLVIKIETGRKKGNKYLRCNEKQFKVDGDNDGHKHKHEYSLNNLDVVLHGADDYANHIKSFSLSNDIPLQVKLTNGKTKRYSNIKQYDDICVENFEKNYKKDDFMNQSNYDYELYDPLKDYYRKSTLYPRFSLQEYCDYIGITEEVEKKLNIDVSILSHESALLYDKANSTLLCINTLTGMRDVTDICRQAKRLGHEVNLLAALNRDLSLRLKVNLKIVGVLMLPDITDEMLNNMGHVCVVCKDKLFITKDKLEYIDNWLNNNELLSRSKSLQIDPVKIDLYKQFASRMVGYYTYKFPEVIISPFDDVFQQIDKLPLNEEQSDILNSDDYHTVLIGPFGSGKSIMASKKLSQLCSTLLRKIYFLCGDANSALVDKMVEIARSLIKKQAQYSVLTYDDILNKIDSHHQSQGTIFVMSLSEFETMKGIEVPNNLPLIIQKIREEEDAHLIIDEFDGEHVLPIQAAAIAETIKEEKMKARHLFLIQQPLSRSHILDEKIRTGYMYEKSGFSVKHLSLTMRTTVAVSALLDCTIRFFNSFQTKTTLPNDNPSTVENEAIKTGKTNDFTVGKSDGKYQQMNIAATRESTTSTDDDKAKTDDAEEGTEINIDPETNVVNIGIDNLLKLRGHQGGSEYGVTILNEFMIRNADSVGHKIPGEKPKVVHPFPENVNFKEFTIDDLYHLYLSFIRFVEIEPKTVFITADAEDIILFELLLKTMGRKYHTYLPISSGVDRECRRAALQQMKESSLLITDHLGVRGLDFRHVVIALSTKEYFLAPFIVETLSRSLSKVTFVLFNWKEVKPEMPIPRILTEWKAKSLVTSYYIKKCSCTSKRNCLKGEMDTYYYHHNDQKNLMYKKCEKIFNKEHTIVVNQYSSEDIERRISAFYNTVLAVVSSNGEEKNTGGKDSIKDNIIAEAELDVTVHIVVEGTLDKGEEDRLMTEFNATTDKFEYVRVLIRDNKTEEVEYLLRSVPSITSLRDDVNTTLLHYAAYFNKLEMVKMMITHGGDPHAQDNDGWTALHWAVSNDHLDVVKHLSQHYPNLLQIRNGYGNTPYSYAQQNNMTDSLSFLTVLASKMGVEPNVEWRKDEARAYKRRRYVKMI